MATNRGRSPRDENAEQGAELAVESASPALDGQVDAANVTAANADEVRALGDPGPEWATGEAAPEVMTSADQRRAGVLDKLRNQGDGMVPRGNGDGGGTLVVVGPATAWLDQALSAEMNTGDNQAAHAIEDILGRVMNARTLEELLAEDEVLEARDLVMVPLQFWGYKVNKSDFADGMKGYMVIEAIRRVDNASVLVSTGAYKVQAQMLRAKTLGLFPFTAHFVENVTKSGNKTLGLVIDKD